MNLFQAIASFFFSVVMVLSVVLMWMLYRDRKLNVYNGVLFVAIFMFALLEIVYL